MVENYWGKRDLPILNYIATKANEVPMALITTSEISKNLDIQIEQVAISCDFLSEAGFFELTKTMGSNLNWYVSKVSSQAMLQTGHWPSPTAVVDELLDTLKEMHSESNDEGTKSRINAILTSVGGEVAGIGREILIEALKRSIFA